MHYSDKDNWYRQIIMDHYNNPRNKGLVEDMSYQMVHLKNPSCGDDLILQVKRVGEQIVDVRHEGSGCAICCSSASMMSENVKNKSVSEATYIIEQFSRMVSNQPTFDEEALEEAISLQGVAKLPPRIKCAMLGYKALQRVLTDKRVEDTDIEEINNK